MEPVGITPSQKKVRSFLGMFIYYQNFIENCSKLAKPLFALTNHVKWEVGAKLRAMQMVQDLQAMSPPGVEAIPAFTHRELQEKQEGECIVQGPVLRKKEMEAFQKGENSQTIKSHNDVKTMGQVRTV